MVSQSHQLHSSICPKATGEAALLLFSGGQDSTTCLAWALERFSRVETIGFDYGQRHSVELEARRTILEQIAEQFPIWRERLGEDHLLDSHVLGQISSTSLTSESAITYDSRGLPSTYVPGRNLLFFVLAAAVAERRNIRNIVAGVCETDYSGYPDCRDDTIKSLQVTLNLGMAQQLILHTPLMWLDKARTWELAAKVGGNDLINLIVEHSHTCYHGNRQKLHPWGYGCGQCPACQLRADGWQRYIDSHA
ncbi:7-cyano-7-deazaguanine synthase QueC [Halorhodospira halochloris]|uniref:7-cyano-7-deazaguanine synthase QueC n=1 Tax=Halorhodospira halochloris TaxID=1052 RepID=UPI001EE93F20|nr:7-cyano-7-deazaguanine synthase QueC [Halorhodospira halochloris]MCG5548418.1 7-cyano-7-deazaguanine synthase QueC [Halorhodospira halochloris]